MGFEEMNLHEGGTAFAGAVPSGASERLLLAGTKGAVEHLGNVLVLGLGSSGKSVARYCKDMLGSRVDGLFIAAGGRTEASEAFVAELLADDARIVAEFGDDAVGTLAQRVDGGKFDTCIVSPGIPFWSQLYTEGQQASDCLMSEVEFAWRESAADSVWVAITGTNGKTTTTSATAHVLAESGLAAAAVGNIGDVCIDAVAAGETSVYVAEVYSYQLASTIDFAPDVAVLLNITPDHIHWHRTLEAYAQAKFKVLDNLGRGCGARAAGNACGDGAEDVEVASDRTDSGETAQGKIVRPVAILDATNDVVRAKVRELKALSDEERGFAYIPMGTADGIRGDMRARCGAANAAFLDADDMLHVAYDGVDHALLGASDLQILGTHNVSNAIAAASVAVALGVSDEDIARGLSSFAPLPHRVEPVGSVAGVKCYNDSKATNVDATIKALESFPKANIVVMLGGDDKDTDLTDLVRAAHAHAKAAVCFGAGAARFHEAFERAADAAPEGFELLLATNMESALDVALSVADSGDMVLLSPACASFDEFRSFEHRGDVFRQLVKERMKDRGV